MATPFNGRSWKTDGCSDYHLQRQPSSCHHFVCERVVSNKIQVIYCPTRDMIAGIMTRGLVKLPFEKLRNLLGVHDIM